MRKFRFSSTLKFDAILCCGSVVHRESLGCLWVHVHRQDVPTNQPPVERNGHLEFMFKFSVKQIRGGIKALLAKRRKEIGTVNINYA